MRSWQGWSWDDGIFGGLGLQPQEPLLRDTEALVVAAGRDIRDNRLCRVAHCNGCDMQGICRSDIGPG